ncbi:MAG: hypothetical protein ACFBSG_09275 [Leptolyngbyaceae cyanobacterium]
MSTHSSAFLSGMPSFFVEQRVYLFRYIFADFGASWSPLVFQTIESLLVACLILLVFGYKTRWTTAGVLVLGCLLEGLSSAIDSKRTLLPLVFYVPFFMTLANTWGKTYSLDALIQERRLSVKVDPHADDGFFFLPARALLIIFSVQFFVSAIFKVAFGGAWLSYSDIMANFFLNRNIEAAIYDLPLNWFAPLISKTPVIYLSIHLTTLVFEFGFFLSLINRKLRDLIISLALIFHAVNALWLVVTVTPILAGYLPFVNWQNVKDRMPVSLVEKSIFEKLPLSSSIFGILFLASFVGLLWHSPVDIRSCLNLFGVINWRTIWLLVLPPAAYWFVATLIHFRQPVSNSTSTAA